MKKYVKISSFTPEQINEIKEKRKQGVVKNILCYEYSISNQTLNKILKHET